MSTRRTAVRASSCGARRSRCFCDQFSRRRPLSGREESRMKRPDSLLLVFAAACGVDTPASRTDRNPSIIELHKMEALPLGPIESRQDVQNFGPTFELPFDLPTDIGRIPDLGPNAPMFFGP